MPYISFDLDALSCAPDVARSAGTTEEKVIAGLARMWAWCFKHRRDVVDGKQLDGFFGSDHTKLVGPLASFLFLAPTTQGTYRIRGAARYLRIKQAQAEAAARTNALRVDTDRSSETAPHGTPDGLPTGLPDGTPSGTPHGQPHGVGQNPDALTPSTEHRAPSTMDPAREDFVSAYDLELAYRKAFLDRNKHEPTNAASDAARVAAWASKNGIRKPELLDGMRRIVAEGKTLFQMTFEWDRWQAKPKGEGAPVKDTRKGPSLAEYY